MKSYESLLFGDVIVVQDFKFTELNAVRRYYPQGHHGIDKEPLSLARKGIPLLEKRTRKKNHGRKLFVWK